MRAAVLPVAVVRPPGSGSIGAVLPYPVYIPADATGGLCIGRSYADVLGRWRPSATNKLRRVYTDALLPTIRTYKRGLNIIGISAIL